MSTSGILFDYAKDRVYTNSFQALAHSTDNVRRYIAEVIYEKVTENYLKRAEVCKKSHSGHWTDENYFFFLYFFFISNSNGIVQPTNQEAAPHNFVSEALTFLKRHFRSHIRLNFVVTLACTCIATRNISNNSNAAVCFQTNGATRIASPSDMRLSPMARAIL